MRTYNLNIYLILFSLLTGFLGWLLDFLANSLNLSLPIALNLSQVNIYLAMGSYYSYTAMTYLLTVLFVSVMI